MSFNLKGMFLNAKGKNTAHMLATNILAKITTMGSYTLKASFRATKVLAHKAVASIRHVYGIKRFPGWFKGFPFVNSVKDFL